MSAVVLLLVPGTPKGVLLKHAAVVASVASLTSYLEAAPAQNLSYGPGDVILSYLPLAHIFDRCGGEAAGTEN